MLTNGSTETQQTNTSSQTKPFRVLGVDPGLQVTGYAIVESVKGKAVVREAGVIRSAEGRTKEEMAIRLQKLHSGLSEVLKQFKPDGMAMEQLFAHYNHPRTAILMGHARGVLMLAAAQHNVSVQSYSATHVKRSITGSGRASKEQIQYTMMRELSLPQLPEPADVADALAVALCHYFECRNAKD